ncbi:hypothetical protein H0W80_00055 [Candidatus Saccharibacteria bacterium]|nr:hypothetical protein [Candidatus Saccharibacteria bacterium]
MNPEGNKVTMTDISNLLTSIGEPGTKQKTKEKAVRQLFQDKGLSGQNPQGIHVADSLESYPEY